MNLILPFFTALILTIIVEFFVLSVVLREQYERIALVVALINLITNPALNFFYLFLEIPLLLLELLVICIETVLITGLLRLSWERALCCSVLANTISFLAGVLIRI